MESSQFSQHQQSRHIFFGNRSQSSAMSSHMPPSTPQPPRHTVVPQSRLAIQSTASKVPVASLLISPPEQTPYETFDQGAQAFPNMASMLHPMQKSRANLAQQPPSPPVSPMKKASNQVQTTTAGSDIEDPILYPEELTSPVQPLFSSRRPSVEATDITRHIDARKFSPLKNGVQTPKRLDYENFAYVVTAWNGAYARLRTDAERAAYQKAELAQVKSDDRARLGARAFASKPAKRSSTTNHKPLMAKPDRATTIAKDVISAATGPRSSAKVTKSGRQSTKPRVKTSPAAEEKKSKSSKTQTVDIDYDHIPDYCPPRDILAVKKMTIPSVSNPRPFEDGELPLLGLLHPQEQELARNLRIGPATYLTTKRRIFVDRLYFYYFEKEVQGEQEAEGIREKPYVKDFKKTHAQHAGKIDVNKSSKLHEAFESVGWFDRKWCEGHPMPTFDNAKDRHFSPGDGNGKPGPQIFFNRKI